MSEHKNVLYKQSTCIPRRFNVEYTWYVCGDEILFLNVKKLLILHLAEITVREFVFHYAIYSCEYLKGRII